MIINLGNTSINYKDETSRNDFIIISQIVDSSMSYEKPVLVRTPAELDIWFGKSFSQYDYLYELLEHQDVSLYLYKPIDTTGSSLIDTIDFSYYVSTNGYYLSYDDLPKEGSDSTIYPVIEEEGKYTVQDSDSLRYNMYIWKDDEYVNVDLLPQFTELNTKSMENRDSLRLVCLEEGSKFNNITFNGPLYSYPKYYNISNKIYDKYTEDISNIINSYSTFEVDMNYIESGDYTFAFDIVFSKEELSDGWFMIPKNLGVNGIPDYIMAYKGPIPEDISEDYYDYKDSNRHKFNTIDELLDIFKNVCGYSVIKNSKLSYTLVCNKQTIISNFYNLPEIESVETNIETNYNILSKLILDLKFPKADFFSKTIGNSGDVDSNISVTINHSDSDPSSFYSIIVSRYNYTESFQGTIKNIPGIERLDKIINKSSKLIYVNFDSGLTMLPVGTWELKRTTEESAEDYNPNMYHYALNTMFDRFEDDGSYVDFLLIDNIQKFIKNGIPDGYTSYQEYNVLLDYAQKGNFQILIQNNPIEHINWTTFNTMEGDVIDLDAIDENVNGEYDNSVFVEDYSNYEGILEKYKYYIYDRENNTLVRTYNAEKTSMLFANDFALNHTLDLENRLVYFYRTINTELGERPGYYLFLDNIITGNTSLTRNNISAITPYKQGEDSREDNLLSEKLKECKCNYLVTNGFDYYYEKLQNGKYFTTSIWMRFISDKIKKEFFKHKWELVGERMDNTLRRKVDSILTTIRKSFPIIVSLDITSYKEIYNENKINISLRTILSDYPENDITLNVALNYTES